MSATTEFAGTRTRPTADKGEREHAPPEVQGRPGGMMCR